jgi:hypothetical protein
LAGTPFDVRTGHCFHLGPEAKDLALYGVALRTSSM